MLSILHNEDGHAYACCEWRVVDDDGRLDKNGSYLYIKDLWIHEKHKGGIRDIINEIDKHPVGHNTLFVYWRNNKKGTVVGPYLKFRLTKLGVRKCI